MIYKISAIRKKAQNLPAGYLDDCMTLCQRWDEDADIAEFSGAAVAEIKQTWENKQLRRHCANCGGL